MTTGIVDLWGLTLSAKLTLTSPPGNTGLNCFEGFEPGACNVVGRSETYYFGEQDFKQLDIALQKNWHTGGGVRLRVRGDLLNVTNERNYADFGNFQGVNLVRNPQFGERTGEGIAGPTRTFKLTLASAGSRGPVPQPRGAGFLVFSTGIGCTDQESLSGKPPFR
ncbi:MAG TPA: hypothetical protein VK325_09005 [Pseudoxanthomonas sp.]|nr:hypothetical protein [Pseudoxanthomonas sp.]